MTIDNLIIEFIKQRPNCSSNEILAGIENKKSLATVKRTLSKLIQEKPIISTGKRKSTRYKLSPVYQLFEAVDIVQSHLEQSIV